MMEAGVLASEALEGLSPGGEAMGSALWLVLGKARLDGDQLALAETAFDAARRLEPAIPIVQLIAGSHVAEILRRQGCLAEAQSEARSALELAREAALEDHPECAVAHLVLCIVHAEMGLDDEAASHLARATELVARIPYEPRQRMLTAAQSKVRSPSRQRRGRLPTNLSQRELDVLRLLTSSLTQPEIAAALYVSTNTVKTHVKRIYQKLGVTSRHAAIERARLDQLL
jgi:LuxR family maltose regulon positive regulatory protein